LTFIDAKIEAVSDFANLRFIYGLLNRSLDLSNRE